MTGPQLLSDYFDRSAAEHPEQVAVEEPDGARVTYAELAELVDRVRDHLWSLGVRRGDRVGIWLRKSIDAVAAIFGILKAGGVYVPVDPTAPASRNGYILANCEAHAALVERRWAEALDQELRGAGHRAELIAVDEVGGGRALRQSLTGHGKPIPEAASVEPASPGDIAYILYTSGSTGKPKGVMLTHENGTTFIDWCSETFAPRSTDRFSAHAPFHFDLSILDIYLSMKHGATLVIIGEELGKEPVGLAQFIADKRITHWYSAPSILSLLAQRGNLGHHDYRALRAVLFAGEVFPIVHLNALRQCWPHVDYFNLYGPTETYVWTLLRLPDQIELDRTEPYPIGKVCSHLRGKVVDEQGNEVARQETGELCIAGPAVMQGYWGQPELSARAFFVDASGVRWYRTGDLVAGDERGDYRFLGRRDRMVKKRGYRVELGEIEACLYRHQEITEAAVVAIPHETQGLMVNAHLVLRGAQRMSLIKLKQFCSEQLPGYMVPDQFVFHDTLPKTSTGKIDYQTLAGK